MTHRELLLNLQIISSSKRLQVCQKPDQNSVIMINCRYDLENVGSIQYTKSYLQTVMRSYRNAGQQRTIFKVILWLKIQQALQTTNRTGVNNAGLVQKKGTPSCAACAGANSTGLTKCPQDGLIRIGWHEKNIDCKQKEPMLSSLMLKNGQKSFKKKKKVAVCSKENRDNLLSISMMKDKK